MSLDLLTTLNGDRRGAFHRYLATLKSAPRIAWYPSAGEDFRDLLYLSRAYSVHHPAIVEPPPPELFLPGEVAGVPRQSTGEPLAPELFLHTDYFPWQMSQFLDTPIIYNDCKTTLTVLELEELPRCDLPLNPGLVTFEEGSTATGRVVFMWVQVQSRLLGDFHCPLLYAFVENAAFCASLALPHQARFSHVVQVRYGGGCGGGGFSVGAWLPNVLKRLGCQVFITDDSDDEDLPADPAIRLFPELDSEQPPCELKSIRTLPGKLWSNHGDITWKMVRV